MVAVEQLKREYTDKYVKVDAARPELARFRDLVGQVKTVNMSGRALVEFLDYHLNIGWYDIDLGCLTVVPKPTEEELAAKKAAEKPAEKAAAKAPAKAEGKPAAAAKPAAGGAKMSVADMLAAARGGGGGAAAKPAAPKAAKSADSPAKPAAAAKPAARAGGAAPAAPAEEAAAAPVAAPAPAATPAKAVAPKATGGRVDRSTMSVADMIAYCREHDVA